MTSARDGAVVGVGGTCQGSTLHHYLGYGEQGYMELSLRVKDGVKGGLRMELVSQDGVRYSGWS